MDWYEAVAIVQAACRAIIESGDPIGPAKLEPTAVFIDATGCVSVASNGARSTPGAIASLGHILSGILPANDVMLLGVRVVSKATSSPPVYRSLEEFSDALAYYERPNRTQLVQAVYDRWRGAPARPAIEVPTPIAESAAPATPAVDHRSRSRSQRIAAAAMITVVAIGGISAWALRSRLPWAGSLLKVPTRAVGAISSRLAAVLDLPRTTEPEPPPALAARPDVNRGRASRITPARPAPNVRAADGSSDLVSPHSISGSTKPSGVPNSSAGDGDSKAIPGVEPDAVMYSANDTDVVPPFAVFPQFLFAVGPGPHREDWPIIEVVVNEQGTVDAVKAQSTPRNLGEYVLVTNALSAAKSWRFRPASKDGQPVRYRALLLLVTH